MASRTLIWIVLFVFGLALYLRIASSKQDNSSLTLRREHNTYLQVRKIISDRYVDPVEQKKLFYGALQGMAESLDRHTVFWPPERYEFERSSTSGHFAGVGIEITFDEEKGLTVVTPLADTPAFEAGLLPGDRIVKIDNQSAHRMKLEEASRLIRGPPDTKVKLTVVRKGAREPIAFDITRAIIKIQSVQEVALLNPPMSLSARIPNEAPRIGYVRVVQFQEDTAEDIEAALEELEGKGLEALVLDLRQNPGGLLTSAVKVCDLFIPEGVIVTTRGRQDGKDPTPEAVYRAHGRGTQRSYPLSILLDSGSASASEIVAGCLRDHKRAVLVGEKTFGKGSVQTIIPVNLGELGDGALKLTTGKYYTPSGKMIDGKGIKPDHEIAFDLDQLQDLLLTRRKRRLKNNDPRRNGKTTPAPVPATDPAGKPGKEGADKKPFRDLQLEKAIEVLSEQMKVRARQEGARKAVE